MVNHKYMDQIDTINSSGTSLVVLLNKAILIDFSNYKLNVYASL